MRLRPRFHRSRSRRAGGPLPGTTLLDSSSIWNAEAGVSGSTTCLAQTTMLKWHGACTSRSARLVGSAAILDYSIGALGGVNNDSAFRSLRPEGARMSSGFRCSRIELAI